MKTKEEMKKAHESARAKNDTDLEVKMKVFESLSKLMPDIVEDFSICRHGDYASCSIRFKYEAKQYGSEPSAYKFAEIFKAVTSKFELTDYILGTGTFTYSQPMAIDRKDKRDDNPDDRENFSIELEVSGSVEEGHSYQFIKASFWVVLDDGMYLEIHVPTSVHSRYQPLSSGRLRDGMYEVNANVTPYFNRWKGDNGGSYRFEYYFKDAEAFLEQARAEGGGR